MRKKKKETKVREGESMIMGTKRESGITLVALVITIIIIIILATVAISFAFGNNGLINRAEDAKEMYANDTAYTEGSIANVESYINDILDNVGGTGGDNPPTPPKKSEIEQAKDSGEKFTETTPIKDDSGDTMYVPGGFGIAKDSATEIDKGVVITDGINEFVWIPVNDEELAEMYNTTTPETASDVALSKSTHGEAVTTTKIYSKLRVRSGDAYTAGAPGDTGIIVREPDILTSTSEGDASTIADRGINLLKSELGYTGSNAEIMKKFA